jgi:hypothetical protein
MEGRAAIHQHLAILRLEEEEAQTLTVQSIIRGGLAAAEQELTTLQVELGLLGKAVMEEMEQGLILPITAVPVVVAQEQLVQTRLTEETEALGCSLQ